MKIKTHFFPFLFFLSSCIGQSNNDYDSLIFEECCIQEHIDKNQKKEWFSILPELDGIVYKWGGDSKTEGFDCSGLIIWLYNQIGIDDFKYQDKTMNDVTANSLLLYNSEKFNNIADLEKGDFIFFDADFNNNIEHLSIFDKKDENDDIWVWDATGEPINKVSYRKIDDFYNKNPKFAHPLFVKKI